MADDDGPSGDEHPPEVQQPGRGAGSQRPQGVQGSTSRLLADLRALEAQVREELAQPVPLSEPSLAGGSGLRGAIKAREFRVLRPVSRRYDRLAADLAGLGAQLAERLLSAEADILRLQREVAGLEAGRQGSGAPAEPLDASGTVSDAYYWAFEQRMRGSAESIGWRLRRYESHAVPLRATADEEEPLWIDIGCGHGEFAVLLREWGWRVLGVDTSIEAVEACRERGFDATLADGVTFLAEYAGPKPLGLSAIQVIEHLPKDRWLAFFEQARRVLTPGGGLLVETINPLNVEALCSSFFADVTHTWPAHPEVARLMAEHAGFATAEVTFTNEDHRGNASDFALWATTAT